MAKYIIRLDDACEKMDIEKWSRMEKLLDRYSIKPLVGIIPNCQDVQMDAYSFDQNFWNKVHTWINKGWAIAMHGYNHVYSTDCGGVNPVNFRSEFAGETLDIQKKKIRQGVEILKSHGICPKVFFAPSHTFDENTIEALKSESEIRIISDTVANKPYTKYGVTFVPQQSGSVRSLPFSVVTFCYHPNTMSEEAYYKLERFLQKNKRKFISFPLQEVRRRVNMIDSLLKSLYFAKRR